MMDDSFRGSRTVTAMFDNAGEAERAISRLRSAGISDSQISYTQGSQSASGSVDYSDSSYRDQHKGFWDSLGDFFFPEEDRYAYAEGLSRGSHMVTVTGFESTMYDTVVDILDDEGSIDLSARESEWRSSGWSGYQGSDYGLAGTTSSSTTGGVQMAADMGGSQSTYGSQQQGFASTGSMGQSTGMGTSGYREGQDLNADGTVKVVEERLEVGKRDVDLGSVRVRSYVREEPVSAEVDLRATRVFVERRPVDRPVGAGDISMTDQVIEAREHMEQPVVAKEARVVEEIGLRQESETVHQTIQDTVRKTEVEIEDERTGERSTLGVNTTRGGSGSTGSGTF